jgi:ectoine hydroxylase-related dioxygenase (phytanoyl-CoA dioxygenase family)
MQLFRAIDAAQALATRDALAGLLATGGPDPRSPFQSRHLDAAIVRELCLTPAILERVRGILGRRIVLWRSNFFPKQSGADAFEWHRDRDHWTTLLDPMINVTAWLALERTTRANGALEFEEGCAELEPGECVLFDQDTLHRSGPNRTGDGRLALAIRYTLPHVRIDRARLFPGYERVELP